MEDKRVNAPAEEELTSASARIMRGLGLDKETRPEIEVEPVGFFENFWYHHKWTTIIVGVALLIVLICTMQMCAKETPDVYVMYAGPGFLTANEAREVQNSFRQVMDDYNGDGERGVMLNAINYLTDAQIQEKLDIAKKEDVDLIIDYAGNNNAYERFSLEVLAGESVICILDPSFYAQLKGAEALMPLEEVLGYVPEGAMDEYGVRFRDTAFSEFFTATHVFPEDSVLCIRRVSVMAAFKGQKKTERAHAYHTELFRSVMEFQMPE